MKQAKSETKEIRLFGDKSIREEAYRQKILQLEKEIHRIESLARSAEPAQEKVESTDMHLDGLYHESLLSFDKRVKREHEFLEKRASEIAERLNLQVQRFGLKVESSLRRKAGWIIFSTYVACFLSIILFAIIFFVFKAHIPGVYTPTGSEFSVSSASDANHDRLSYIKRVLQTQNTYRHQYEMVYLDYINGIYVGEAQLNFLPENRWYLKDICTEILNVFHKYSMNKPAEFTFLHKGKIYLKAYAGGANQKSRLQYFY
ncbi:hypothetical protein ACFL0T_01625 [Candidatus Omnitrophota bacterium]